MATWSSYDPLSQGLRNLTLSYSEDQELSYRIQSYYNIHKQTEKEIAQKEETRAVLEAVLKLHLGSDARVHMVGSSLTNFATSSSDMDIVLTKSLELSNNTEVDQLKVNQIMQLVYEILKGNSGMDNLEFRHGRTVRVPIIRGEDHTCSRNILWELSFKRTENILKTKLLRAYSLLDPRVAPLVIAVKAWAAHVGVKDAREGTLSSYSWTLMVICYLQCTSPPVLPCLQTLDKVKYDVSLDNALTVDVKEQPPAFVSRNTDSMCGLLTGFFNFYLREFNYTAYAVSVRQGKLIPKSEVLSGPRPGQWTYFCIEEPYGETLSNTARAMFDTKPCEKVLLAILDAHSELSNGRILPGLDLTSKPGN